MVAKFLETTRQTVFRRGFLYGRYLDHLNNHPSFYQREIISRSTALGIPLWSFLCLIEDIHYVGWHILFTLFSLLTRKRSIYVLNHTVKFLVVVEIATHILAIFFAGFIALYSPSRARKFLPSNQSFLEQGKGRITPKEAAILYGLLYRVDDLFTKHGIKYAIIAGTLLGKERHDGIIPWDDDADLLLLDSDEPKFLHLKKEFERYRIGIRPFSVRGKKHLTGYKIFYKNEKENHEPHYPFIDLFIGQKRENKIEYRDPWSRLSFPGEYFTYQEWDQLTKVQFGPIQLSGLKDSSSYVHRSFGKNSMEYGFSHFNHKEHRLKLPKKYFLEKNYRTESGELKCKPIAYDEEVFKELTKEIEF